VTGIIVEPTVPLLAEGILATGAMLLVISGTSLDSADVDIEAAAFSGSASE